MRFKAIAMCLFATTLAYSESAAADSPQIIVSDCESTPRLIEEIGDLKQVGLRANVVDSQSARVTVTLTNANGEPYIQSTNEGSVEFQNLTAGQWTMCLEPASAEATDIEIVRPNSNSFEAVSIVGASAAGVLAIALGGSESGGSSAARSSADTSSLVSTASSVTQPIEVVPATVNPPTDSARDTICFIGEDDEVEVISVFK